MEWLMIPACPSLMCSFNRGAIEGANSSKKIVWCFMFAKWLVLWIALTEGAYICERHLEMCVCLWPEFDCLEVTLCGWRDVKIQLLLLLPPSHPTPPLSGPAISLMYPYTLILGFQYLIRDNSALISWSTKIPLWCTDCGLGCGKNCIQ